MVSEVLFRKNQEKNSMNNFYSDSFVYGALALSLVTVKTTFTGLYDSFSLGCNAIYLVLFGYSLFAVINQRNKIVETIKIDSNDC